MGDCVIAVWWICLLCSGGAVALGQNTNVKEVISCDDIMSTGHCNLFEFLVVLKSLTITTGVFSKLTGFSYATFGGLKNQRKSLYIRPHRTF